MGEMTRGYENTNIPHDDSPRSAEDTSQPVKRHDAAVDNKDSSLLESFRRKIKRMTLGVVFFGAVSCLKPDVHPVRSDLPEAIVYEDLEYLKRSPDLKLPAGERTRHDEYSTPHLRNQQEFEEEIWRQKQWLMNYIGSDMYRDRLMEEFYADDGDMTEVRAAVERAVKERLQNINSGQYHLLTQLDTRGPGWVAGFYEPSNKAKAKYGGHKIASDPDRTLLAIPEGDVAFSTSTLFGDENVKQHEEVPVHEFTHQSLDGVKSIPVATRVKIRALTQTDFAGYLDKDSGLVFGYLDNPSEVIARMNELRHLLKKHHLYDAASDVFTNEHVEKLLRNTEIMNNLNVQNLLDIVRDRKALVTLMNSVADISELLEQDSKMA
jgi:hypothetical protein